MHPLPRLAALALLALGPVATPAAVTASGAAGFVVREEAVYAGPPEAAWRRLLEPARWWDPAHTYSRDARRLTLAARPGGCFCERLPDGGFVRHLEVVYAAPRDTLRLAGGLGPLQAMGATGALTFTLRADGAATRIVVSYAVSGYAPDGWERLAGAVDAVLGEQLARLAAP
ncbi:MAG: ATPase [Proteobacteria bacterium]|nr:ATPase [Pseudomonadota bacterium]